jgi:hypothetical protein
LSELPPSGERLDSWKAIAEYLQRDLATVRRWEKNLRLPVRRVAGTGRSVFAYTSEIDDWLQTAKPAVAGHDATVSPPAPIISMRAHSWRWLALPAVVLAVAGGLFVRARRATPEGVRVEITSAGVIARDGTGMEQWRHPFPATYNTVVRPESVQITGGTHPGVYFATSYRGRQTDNEVESGTLTLLDLKGRPQRSFSFRDEVRFQGKSYGPPWALTAFAINEAHGRRRVALTAHHYVWDPSLVTILDDQWQRRATFVHAGWIEGVRWLGPERLLIAGFSNAHDGGMIALLDPEALNGQGPEPAGSRHFCETCGTNTPLRMFVFPRTELNRVTASPFNRVVVQTWDDRLVVRTIESSSIGGDADALYEFTSSLDLVSATFGERYWDMHRALQAEGKITHTREQCADRDGPRQIQVWEPATGWRTVQIHGERTFKVIR